MSPKTVRVVAAVLAAVAVISIALLVVVSAPPARGSTPAWCNYPEPASVAALNRAVAAHIAQIHRWSPDQHPDPFTIQLDLMTECA